MNNNIHPLLVHFPIALISLYAVLEIARFKFFTKSSWYFQMKALLVILGALATYPTMLAGDAIAHQLRGNGLDALIELHSNFAAATAAVSSIIAGAYIIAWINREANLDKAFFRTVAWRFLTAIQKFITETPVVIILAIVVLGLVVITGALGGTIVYGPNFEPFAHFIYSLFFRS